MSRTRLAVILGVMAAALILVGALIVSQPFGKRGGPSELRTDCIPLTLVSSDEKAELLRRLANDYMTSGSEVDGKCVAVTVAVTGSAETAERLARDSRTVWNEAVDKARPDVWSPSSSVWVEALRARTANNAGLASVPPSTDIPSLATTPVVIAMPQRMATALGWPRARLGWRDLVGLARDPQGWGSVGHPEWGLFALGKTNPSVSTTGLLATTATAAALAGPVELTADALRRPQVIDDLRALEARSVHYGKYISTFVNNLYEADRTNRAVDYISAIAMEEKVVRDYNRGLLVGESPRSVPEPKEKLVAIYPVDGTTASDNPYVILDAKWVTDQKRRAAIDFLKFLDKQQEEFAKEGFRDAEGAAGEALRNEPGLQAKPEYRQVRTPSAEVSDAVRQLWQEVRRRASVLILVDESGSMSDPAAGGKTRLALAKEAAAQVPDLLENDDELGLWAFSAQSGTQEAPWRELIGVAPVRDVTERYRNALQDLRPQGNTPLYAATRAAAETMERRFDPSRINAVVLLSDGANKYSQDDDLERLRVDLNAENKDRAVRVFPIGYSTDADAGALRTIAVATRADYYDASDPTAVVTVLRDALSNF